MLELPISTNPKEKLNCEKCNYKTMSRKLVSFQGHVMKKPGTLGKWYKNKTGKDLLDGCG